MVGNYFQRHIALPQDHGSWVFLLSPLLIGLFAGGNWTAATPYLFVSALAAFLVRQPVTIAIKAYSGRRSKRDLPAARFWILVYCITGAMGIVGLILLGFGYLLYLAIPGVPVFAWHLWLVSKRSERRQVGIEVVASGVLALAAPAGYWVGKGAPESIGWWLWGLTWLQSAASIVYAYLRLEQRVLNSTPTRIQSVRLAGRALLYTSFNLVAVGLFSIMGWLPALLPIPYALQWLETIIGTLNPAIGIKPTVIGVRQLIISSLFTILFIIFWNLSA